MAISTLLNNRLSIIPGGTVVFGITDIRAVDDVTSSDELVFSVIDIHHGYFSRLQASHLPITQFAQQSIRDAEIIFVHDGSQKSPSYFLTVTDAAKLTAQPREADVNFTLPVKVTHSDTLRNAIIGGVISGVIGIVFFALKFCLNRKAMQYLEQALSEAEGVGRQQAEFHKNVIRPIVKRILDRVDVTGFLGYVSNQTLKDTLDAITALVHQLQTQGVAMDLTQLDAAEQNRLLNTIARKTRQILVPKVSYCSSARLSRFFCPEVTPQQIEENVLTIAEAVKSSLQISENRVNVGENKEEDLELTVLAGNKDVPSSDASQSSFVSRAAFFSAEQGLALSRQVEQMQRTLNRLSEGLNALQT